MNWNIERNFQICISVPLKSHVLQCTAKSNRVKSLFTTTQHTLDRMRKVTILVTKHKVMEMERSAC